MKVFIAGGTGVLGRRIVAGLCARGDRVVALVRSAEGERKIGELGGEACRGDIFDSEGMARRAKGCEVVIHVASSVPVKGARFRRRWRMNDRLHREGTQALTACAARIDARLFVQQSVVWVAAPPDGTFFDEESPPAPSPRFRADLDGERIVQAAGRKYGFQTAILRCGWFYGEDAPHTRFFAQNLRAGRLPIVGEGNAQWACLHLDDAAGAFMTAVTAGREGRWHVVDDEPVRVSDFLRYFAQRLGAPPPRHVPVWLARMVAGSYATAFFTRSVRTSNARFRREFSWHPRFPTYREGIDAVTAAL
ncbi:MAG: NAD(P)-dependent oxidoreductase [Deltaproteobacteria bacterium]|nr:MAG: NAD(P)-dependent oxidoreductase [Deltaproteobacteria bacterium]